MTRRARNRYLYRKKTVLRCHRCLIKTGVDKNEQHLNIDKNFDHRMSLSKRLFWNSNNRLHFFSKRAVPFLPATRREGSRPLEPSSGS